MRKTKDFEAEVLKRREAERILDDHRQRSLELENQNSNTISGLNEKIRRRDDTLKMKESERESAVNQMKEIRIAKTEAESEFTKR